MTTKTPKAKTKRVVKRPEGTAQLNVNLPVELLERLDAWVEKLNAQPAGPRWTRTDIVRTALTRIVEERAEKGEAP